MWGVCYLVAYPVGNGFLSFGGIDVPEDRDLTDIDHVVLLENDDSFEEEYPDTRRHCFIFKTNGIKPSAEFRNKADFDVQFDILAQASADIVAILEEFFIRSRDDIQ